MDKLRIQCTNPDCARRLAVPSTALGHRVRCPACKQELLVPGTIEELHRLDNTRHHRLRVVKGPAFLGAEYRLEPERGYTVGRSDECNLQLPGPTISRRHFSVHWVNNQWVLEDLNTSTGTQVDGLVVTKHALRGGETIELGAYTLRFVAPGAELHPDKPGAALVVTPGNAEPLPVHSDPSDLEEAVKHEQRVLREARGFTTFTDEHLSATGRESSQHLKLSLATRLVAAAALLVLVTVLSIFAKGWFSSRSPQPVETAQRALPPPPPAEFTEALRARQFQSALELVQQTETADSSDPRLADMKRHFTDEVNRYRAGLRTEARAALDHDEFNRAAELFNTAQAAPLGPLPNDWKPIATELQLNELLVRAQNCRQQGRGQEALGELDKAAKLSNSDRLKQRVAELQRAVLADLGSGLLVKVTPDDAGARVTVGEREIERLGEAQWKLPAGPVALRAAAPGYLPFEGRVTLKAGQLAEIEVPLEPAAPPAVWVLLALERAEALAPLWLAARHYGATSAVAPELTDHAVAVAEKQVEGKLGKNKLRVAKLVLKNGSGLAARVISETSTMISVQVLPDGDLRAIQADDVVKKEDLSTEAATTAMLDWIRNRRKERTSALETLEELARLRLALGDQEEVATRVCGGLVAECLQRLEDCCAWCAGTGGRPCTQCDGKGKIQQLVVCPFCKGAARVDCFECKGRGKTDCKVCGGTGRVTTRVPNAFGYREVEERCKACRGLGEIECRKCGGARQVTCPKCKGTRKIEEKVNCPACKQGQAPCPACGGTGTKEGMRPEKRMEAEREAAQRMSAAGE